MDPTLESARSPSSLAQTEAKLTRIYGAIVGGARLTRALGYPTQAAFRQAVARGRVPVRVFTIPGRRGKFAQVQDIAAWVHQVASGCHGAPETRRLARDAPSRSEVRMS